MQNYIVIKDGVAIDAIVWGGNIDSYTPPTGAVALQIDMTPALNWDFDDASHDFVLRETGVGCIGYTFDNGILVTNLPKPEMALPAATDPAATDPAPLPVT